VAPRMHQNMQLETQKLKKNMGKEGRCPLPSPLPQWAGEYGTPPRTLLHSISACGTSTTQPPRLKSKS